MDSYGAPTPLKSLATVTVPDSTTLQINPFDPASIKEIERAINVGASSWQRRGPGS